MNSAADYQTDDDDDDDSDFCPSLVSKERANSANSESSSITSAEDLEGFEEVDTDELFALTNEWEAVEFKGQVRLHFDSIDESFAEKLKEQITVLRQRIDDKRKTFTRRDEQRMNEDVSLFNCFATSDIWHHLHEIANKNRPNNSEAITMREMELVCRLIFALGYYGHALDRCISHSAEYPCVAAILEEWPGGGTRAELVLRSLDCIKTHGQHYGTVWDAPFEQNLDLKKLERLVTEACSSIVFQKGSSNFIIDDDKMRNRSERAAQLGYPRSKGLKSFGPVNNLVGQLPSGHLVGCAMTCSGDSALDTTKRIFKRICGAEDDKEIDLTGCTLGGDRGYQDDEMQFNFAPEKNLECVYTTKRGAAIPWKFGETKYKSAREQCVVSENGPRTVFMAVRKLATGKFSHLLLYRSGTGRCTLIASSKAQMEARDWNLVAKNQDDMAKWRAKTFKSERFVENLLPESACISLTSRQRGPEWFLLRQFSFSSTTAVETLNHLNKSLLSESQLALLENDIGLTLIDPDEERNEDPREKYKNYIEMSVDDLVKNTQTKLYKICQAFDVKGRTKIKRDKVAMAKKIKEGPVGGPPIERTELENFIQASFLKPLNKNMKQLAMGTANEINVLNSLKEHLKTSRIVTLDETPTEVGLASRKATRAFVTSPDGISKAESVRIFGNQPSKGIAHEIKTFTKPETIREVEEAVAEPVTYCKFGDATFKWIVQRLGYHVQVIHHAMVLQVDYVLFTSACPNHIINCLLVECPKAKRDCYESILRDYKVQHLKPIYENGEDLPKMSERSLSKGSYIVEFETVLLNLALWRAVNEQVKKNEGPVPALRHMLPRVICWWNPAKGMVDVLSRYMRNIQLIIGKASPALVLLVRLLILLAINGCLTKKLLCDGSEILREKEGIGYRKLKQIIAKHLPLKDYVLSLAKHYRLPLALQGGSDGTRRTAFTPEKRHLVASLEGDEQSNQDRVYVFLNETLPATRKCRYKLFVDGIGKEIRLSKVFHPVVEFVDANNSKLDWKACVLCGTDCPTQCLLCGVHLCIKKQQGGDCSCSEHFHDHETDLENAFAELRDQAAQHNKKRRSN